jgi:hypothetical protein
MTMAVFINFKGAEGLETIDEFETHREAQAAIREYRANQSFDGELYISTRSIRAWREASHPKD